MNKTLSFVEIFFNFQDAKQWIDFLLSEEYSSDMDVSSMEIKLMPSGGYRAGIVFANKQQELFEIV